MDMLLRDDNKIKKGVNKASIINNKNLKNNPDKNVCLSGQLN